jgi:ketosteroid isomerase-like protein
MLMMRTAAAFALVSASLSAALAAQPAAMHAVPQSARGAVAAVDGFHAALRGGDTAAAAALLDDRLLVFEGKAERSKAEYLASHLAADAAYSAAVASTLVERSAGSEGAGAWVASVYRATGSYNGKPVDRLSSETMVLRRERGQWKIVHIHWSSAPVQP